MVRSNSKGPSPTVQDDMFLLCGGFREHDGVIEGFLQRGKVVRRGVGGPGEGDGSEGRGNHEAIPRPEIEGQWAAALVGAPSQVCSGELRDLHRAGLATRDVPRGPSAVKAQRWPSCCKHQPCRARRRGSARGTRGRGRSRDADGAGDELAIERARDENGDVLIAEAVRAGQHGRSARRRRMWGQGW